MNRDKIITVIIVASFAAAVLGWLWFYFTSCAFTPIVDAPVICLAGR